MKPHRLKQIALVPASKRLGGACTGFQRRIFRHLYRVDHAIPSAVQLCREINLLGHHSTGARNVPNNLKFVAHALRRRRAASRQGMGPHIGNAAGDWGNSGLPGGQEFMSKEFWGGHSAIGGNSYYNLGRNTLNPKAAYESDEYIRNGIYSQGVKIP